MLAWHAALEPDWSKVWRPWPRQPRQPPTRFCWQQHLANAIALHMICPHLIRGEGLHPVDQWSLFDDVDLGAKCHQTGFFRTV